MNMSDLIFGFFKQVALSVASGGSNQSRVTGASVVKSPTSPPAATSATFVLTPAMTQQIVKQVGGAARFCTSQFTLGLYYLAAKDC